ncbi:DNA primase [Oscillospiraceae bacterium OttesenSCG-928-G22]|nr:DNA primase [Oscillospiraceae bacterium OttesenSCG-928-G22]
MAFSASFLDELLDRSDIIEIVSAYVQLKQKGANLFGLCPFHSEKTPSFSVSGDKQIYHCFGCGAGGNAINFVMRVENLEFPEAVRFLAERVGMPIEEENADSRRQEREKILTANREAARFFHSTLMADAGEAARAYFERRAISRGTIRRFGLGFAPDSWDGLIRAMAEKGIDKATLLDAGLVVKNKTGGVYDRFRGRVIFPIIDLRGNVVAFGGRVLDDTLPKYLNSPETAVYHKGKTLFAMNLAKKSKEGRILLAEGYMDVIALHQAGFDSAVASLGTSLTPDQARLISRYASEAIICYDADTAGKTAANRAIELLEKAGVKVKVLKLEGAKDPDEFISKFGADAFRLRLNRSENHIEYKLALLRAQYRLEMEEERIEYLKAAAALLATVESPVERSVYAAKVAEEGNVPPEVIEKEAAAAWKKRRRGEKQKERRETMAPAKAMQPKSRELKYQNVRSAAAEEGLLALLLRDGDLLPFAEAKIAPSDFSSELLGGMFETLLSLHRDGHAVTLKSILALLEPEAGEHLVHITEKTVTPEDASSAAADYIDIIQTEKLKEEESGDALLMKVREKHIEKLENKSVEE